MKQVKDCHGISSLCIFASEEFRHVVYKPEYCTQVIHHVAVCDINYMIFVVAAQTKVQYAMLIYFPTTKWFEIFSVRIGRFPENGR